MVQKLFIQKIRHIDLSIAKTKERKAELLKKERSESEAERKAVVDVIAIMEKEQELLENERENLIRGAFLSRGITKKDFCALIADYTYRKVDGEIKRVDNFPV